MKRIASDYQTSRRAPGFLASPWIGYALALSYRISQEAVTNARWHGRAKCIRLTLDIQPASVRLDVSDDGIGFAQPAADAAGMGLKFMQIRATNIGAFLSIRAGENGGTLVSVLCPQQA